MAHRVGVGDVLARFAARLVPTDQRRRDVALVLVLLAVATAVSASLPGGWADSSSMEPSGDPSSQRESTELVALIGADPWRPAPTVYLRSTLPPAPETPHLPPTYAPTPSPTPPHKIYTFVALGDSLTAWPANPWPVRLDSMDPYMRLVKNAGAPADLTSGMLARLNTDVLPYKPNVLFVLGGTNDVGHHVSQATTIANLRAILVAARAKGIVVMLMTIPPRSDTQDLEVIASLNAAIVHLANSYRLVVIDIHAVLSTPGGIYIPAYTSDGLHFSSSGAQVVASTVYNRIRRSGY